MGMSIVFYYCEGSLSIIGSIFIYVCQLPTNVRLLADICQFEWVVIFSCHHRNIERLSLPGHSTGHSDRNSTNKRQHITWCLYWHWDLTDRFQIHLYSGGRIYETSRLTYYHMLDKCSLGGQWMLAHKLNFTRSNNWSVMGLFWNLLCYLGDMCICHYRKVSYFLPFSESILESASLYEQHIVVPS